MFSAGKNAAAYRPDDDAKQIGLVTEGLMTLVI